MFRRDRVKGVITNLQNNFQLITNENNHTNINKQPYYSKLTITKLSESIKQIYQLLYGTIDNDPKQEYVCKLIPKLMDPKHDLFYKLSLYRTHFSHETQSDVSKILKFIIENGTKYANFNVSKYIKDHYDPQTKHNKIIDSLINNVDQHPGCIFPVLQQMTKRSDLKSMFLKLKIKSPLINKKPKQLQNYNKLHSKHYKSQSYTRRHTNINAIQLKHYKNSSAPALLDVGRKHAQSELCRAATAATEETKEPEYDFENDVSFVKGLFILINCPSLHISLDAVKTLKYLFSYNTLQPNICDTLSTYLYNNYDEIFPELNRLINSDNAIHKRQSFLLLSDILTDANNFDILLKYITIKNNFVISKRILTDEFIINQNDLNNHNSIIDGLLEDYFESAGFILEYIASKSTLSNLLLNNTFITRLKENECDEKIDINDIKNAYNVVVETGKASHKNLSDYFGMNSTMQITLPQLSNSVTSLSEQWSLLSPGGTTVRNRYSGEDMPCFKRSPLNSVQLPVRNGEEGIMERSFVMELICLINRSCSDLVAKYSFNVLRLLLTVNKQYASKYLKENYLELIKKFRELIKIENENKMRQEQFLRLLCDLLLEQTNMEFKKQFVCDAVNLKIIMNLLNCKSNAIQFYAFKIFEIFVNNNGKNRETHVILWRNTKQKNLIKFIENLLVNNRYYDLEADKKVVIQYLNKIPTPKTDISYKNIPMPLEI